MPQGNDLPNTFRTDVQAYILVNNKRYPVSLLEMMYRPDELPFAYVEIPIGRKAPKNPPTVTAELTGSGDLIAQINPMTPLTIMVKCQAYGNPPVDAEGKKKLRGYVDNEWMRIFSGYVLSPWIRKHRGGYASMALTAMGELGKLAASTSYVNGINKGVGEIGGINIPTIDTSFGVESGVVQSVIAMIQRKNPADNISASILFLLNQLVTMKAIKSTLPRSNEAALSAINRLQAVEHDSTPAGFPIKAGSGATNVGSPSSPVSGADFNKMLQWSVSRHFADLTYAGWAHGLTDGGGDLWTVFQGLIKSFLLSVIPTARAHDFIVPIYYGLGTKEFRTIDSNEYWKVETGKSFTPKDFAYVSDVLMYSTRADPMIIVSDGNRGTGFSTPLMGSSSFRPRNDEKGRVQIIDAPAWAVPPANLVPQAVAKNDSLPDSGAPNDDPTVAIERPANEFWYDRGLGDQICDWTLGFLSYVHRVIAITGRLRFDIAPGSLIKVTFIEDLYTRKNVKRYAMYGYVAEVRTSIGSRGRGTAAHTVLTLSHVHNTEEHERFEKLHLTHPVYKTAWIGTHLVDGADQ